MWFHSLVIPSTLPEAVFGCIAFFLKSERYFALFHLDTSYRVVSVELRDKGTPLFNLVLDAVVSLVLQIYNYPIGSSIVRGKGDIHYRQMIEDLHILTLETMDKLIDAH